MSDAGALAGFRDVSEYIAEQRKDPRKAAAMDRAAPKVKRYLDCLRLRLDAGEPIPEITDWPEHQ